MTCRARTTKTPRNFGWRRSLPSLEKRTWHSSGLTKHIKSTPSGCHSSTCTHTWIRCETTHAFSPCSPGSASPTDLRLVRAGSGAGGGLDFRCARAFAVPFSGAEQLVKVERFDQEAIGPERGGVLADVPRP